MPASPQAALGAFPIAAASANLQFASVVAEFAMLLRASRFKGKSSFHDVLGRVNLSMTPDPDGYRAEFGRLVKSAEDLTRAKR